MDIQEDAWKLIKTLGNELRIKQDEKELKKSYYTQKNSIF